MFIYFLVFFQLAIIERKKFNKITLTNLWGRESILYIIL